MTKIDAIITSKQAPSQVSFKKFLQGQNKTFTWLIILLMAVQFSIFKLLYPFPDFFSDSYSYLFAAYAHLPVNIWPIGYSKFLSLFPWFTHSGTALVTFQYFFFAASALYFYNTITYFYYTGKNTRIVLSLFLFFNPLFLYLANYVTSDILFVSMSMIWVTQLIWLINMPQLYHLMLQAVLIFIMFTFRYNAMIYPLITSIVFLVSKQRIWIKLAGVISGPLLILPFILFSSQSAKKMTEKAQFPPILGGWQWGNNALYIREFIEEDSTKFPSPETAELDKIARDFFRTVPPQYRDLSNEVANFFFRHPEAPLKQYMSRHFHPKNQYEDVVAWGKVAIVFDQYGKYLIKRHPLAFARHFMLVNTKNYFLPPLEKLEIYNLGQDEIWPMGQIWFHYPSKVKSVSKNLQEKVLGLFPILYLMLNLYFIFSLYLFIKHGGAKTADKNIRYTVLIITIFLSLNFAFSVFANIIVLRYQIFPMLILLTCCALLTDYLEIIYVKDQKRYHIKERSDTPHLQ